jgi:hypothetical protein
MSSSLSSSVCLISDQRGASIGAVRTGGGELGSGAKVGEPCLLCHPPLAGSAIICCQLASKEDKIGCFGS